MRNKVSKAIAVVLLLSGLAALPLSLAACGGDPLIAPVVNDPVNSDSEASKEDPQN